MKKQILLYYKYVNISDPKAFMQDHRLLCERLGLKGRIIIASEGLNGTLEGSVEATEEYIKFMREDKRFADFSDMHFKKSAGMKEYIRNGKREASAFPRLSIKVRDEIVSLRQNVDPNKVTGKRLSPEELHRWFKEGKEFEIIDMRNDYEHKVGHFRGSVLPPLENFRDLPKVLPKLKPLKKKTVLTVCTGGVRCEKASGYLVEKGFEDVYQLDGGIVSYMEKYPGKDFLGSLYVFDQRVSMHFDKPNEHVAISSCALCAKPSERYLNCSNLKCHKHFICCEDCAPKAGEGYCDSCKNASRQLFSRSLPESFLGFFKNLFFFRR